MVNSRKRRQAGAREWDRHAFSIIFECSLSTSLFMCMGGSLETFGFGVLG